MNTPLFPTTDAERKAIPIWTYITKYVPRALIAATRVSVKGNIQHNPERAPTDIVWARGKSMDQLNTAARHLMDHSSGTIYDTDGELHLAKAYWRIGAELELLCERLEAEAAEKPAQPAAAAECCSHEWHPFGIRKRRVEIVECRKCGITRHLVKAPITRAADSAGACLCPSNLGGPHPGCPVHGRAVCDL